ncbi:hypothetical protein QA447_05505 [Pseudomonas sp. abacavir_1]
MQRANHLGFIELLGDARLTDVDMAYMNAARTEFENLASLIRQVVIPAVGGWQSPISKELGAHLENVQVLSSNFCWRHRHVGAAHDAREVLTSGPSKVLAQGGAA